MSAVLAQGDTTTTVLDPVGEVVEGIRNLDEACGGDPSWVCEQVYDATGNDTFAGLADWIVAKPLTILVIVVAAGLVARLARRVVTRFFTRLVARRSVEDAAAPRRRLTATVLTVTPGEGARTQARVHALTTVFRSLVTIVVWFVAVVAILGVLGVNLGPLIAATGVVGVALGFGAQNIVRDFLAGTFILLEDQYGVGDVVDLGEPKGTVEKITLRSTRLRDVHGTVWHVPNGQILRAANKSQEWARAVLDLEVATDADYDEVAAAIEAVAHAMADEPVWQADMLEPPELWGVEAFTATGYTVRLVVKTSPAAQFGVMRELRRRLREALVEQGAWAPAPPQELWVHDGDRHPPA
ncbi:MAG: mechanosensitive ion channel family protein [Acidimicrobiales bacterium]|jgi:small conductance mechanosensitive channel|nr:mechanosensitive ion channel family protein [Acidimicrobiales bacterium]